MIPLVERVDEMALAVWRLLGCRDGGRVDIRCDAQDQPHFLEVNPLPGLHPQHSDLPILCGFMGIPYVDLIDRIVRSARQRMRAESRLGSAWLDAKLGLGRVTASVKAARAAMTMRVAVLHNAVPADAPLEDQDTLVQVEAVSAALTRLGHEPATVSCTLDLAALRDELLRLRPDVVFNLVESLAEADSLGYLPLAVLDVLGSVYGQPDGGTFLTTHKLLAKQRLQQAGLPTPAWMESQKTIHEASQGKIEGK